MERIGAVIPSAACGNAKPVWSLMFDRTRVSEPFLDCLTAEWRVFDFEIELVTGIGGVPHALSRYGSLSLLAGQILARSQE